MANTRELRRRIRSVKNTSQITKAMQMVSATKMRRAQNQAVNGRPYSLTVLNVISSLTEAVDPELHPLLKPNSSQKVAVVVLTSDKGLCGSLNTNILRTLQSSDLFKGEVAYYTIGKKGRDFLVRTGKNLVGDFEHPEKVQFRQAVSIGRVLIESFLNKEVGKVYLLYPEFVSTLRQEAKVVQLLPLVDINGAQKISPEKPLDVANLLYEPSVDAVLDFALIHHIETHIYQALLETKASEHSARMIAMQNATDNALELVEDLNLTYNQVRQSAITTELLEITSAAAALA